MAAKRWGGALLASISNPSMADEKDMFKVSWRINSKSVKIRKEEDEEKVRFLLLDLQFYGNYFFTLGEYKRLEINPQHLDLLSDTVTENRRMRRCILLAIENYHLHANRVSFLEENLLVWKEQMVQNYSVLLNAADPEVYISGRNMVQFISNICSIVIDTLRYRDDLDDDEKQVINASQANLRFLRAYVQIAESEVMKSLLNCIQGYTHKVEVLLFHFWIEKTRGRKRDLLLSALQQGVINVDKPCSLLVILDVFKMSDKIFLRGGISWNVKPVDEEISLNFIWESVLDCIPEFVKDCFCISRLSVFPELGNGIQLLHERLAFFASCLEDVSLNMQVLFVRAVVSLVFFYVFSFQDSSDVIEFVKFQVSIMNTCLHISMVEIMLMKLLGHESSLIIFKMSLTRELENGLKGLRKCLTNMEDGYLEDNVQLMSQIKAVPCDALSFFKLLDDHERIEREDDDCVEIDRAFLKLVGTTSLIQAHLSALKLLNYHKDSQMEGQIVKLFDKLGFLVELLINLKETNVNQILFLLDTVAVANDVASLIRFFETDMKKHINSILYRLITDVELLEAEMMLNSFLKHHFDVIVPFTNIEMLMKGFRYLRIVLTSSEKPYLRDEELLLLGDELIKDAIPLISKLFHNISNKDISIELNDLVSDFLRNTIAWETNITTRYLQNQRSSHSAYPRTDRLGFIDFLVDNLSVLSICMPASPWMKYQIGKAFKELRYGRSLLNDILWEHNELDNLVSQLTQAAYELEYVVEAFAVNFGRFWSKRLWISELIDEIKRISTKIRTVLANKSYIDGVDNPSGTSVRVSLPVGDNTLYSNEVIVGMEEQEEKVTNQLIRGSAKLGIVSIVGMGGLGKTTLAKKVFDSPSVKHSFDVRAWCTISKVYQKQEILLEILGHVTEITPEITKMTDDDLSNRLRQLLLERTYLIVMDDMWDILAWNDLQQSFPKGENRSRILFTSRITDIASKSGYGFEPCSLDPLSDLQSWELLERKLFDGKTYPLQLRDIGWEIAVKCKGLPLAIVVISGLLSTNELNLDWWAQVTDNLNSIVVDNSINIIDLSYRYLPDYLKPCFLYFSAFKDDKTVLVSDLIDLWTTEGFIRKRNDDKHVTDVARDYLFELVRRNLISVAERTSMGGIKSCRVHDLLHELCCARAIEENFLLVVKDLDSDFIEHRRVCVYSDDIFQFSMSIPSGKSVRSLVLFPTKGVQPWIYTVNAQRISSTFRLLRTLKLDSLDIGDSFPEELESLIHLRFLSILGTMRSIPGSIERLFNLEVFYVKGLRGEIELTENIWMLEKLRKLHLKDRFVFISVMECLSDLPNLESLSTVFLPYDESTENILLRLQRLKKLKCIFSESWNPVTKINRFPVLDSLNQLESLKVLYHGIVRHPSVFSFPVTIKKLTLSKFRLPWKDISTIGSLPCLEVLKLVSKAFEGQKWEVVSEEFQKLRYLKLDSLDIIRWNTSYDSFPCLEKIVLQGCKKLEEVPFAFGESSTLQMIKAQWCNGSVSKSIKDIRDEQMEASGRELIVFTQS